MGRFASTVAWYENFRPPYAPDFFETVARRLRLRRESSLIDLGTGPGILALGFAPYVGRVVGVDPEPAMLSAARAAAARASRDLNLIESKAEMLPAGVETYDVVTIGRALHWMQPQLTATLFNRLIAPGGVILVCGSSSVTDGRNAWLEIYNKVRRAWTRAAGNDRYSRDLATVLRGTRFQPEETITVEGRHQISVRDLAFRMLTFSSHNYMVDKASDWG